MFIRFIIDIYDIIEYNKALKEATDMHKSIFKVFFSHEKETDWLNRLGKQGYLLCGISDSKYLFEINDGVEYKYSIEHLD